MAKDVTDNRGKSRQFVFDRTIVFSSIQRQNVTERSIRISRLYEYADVYLSMGLEQRAEIFFRIQVWKSLDFHVSLPEN